MPPFEAARFPGQDWNKKNELSREEKELKGSLYPRMKQLLPGTRKVGDEPRFSKVAIYQTDGQKGTDRFTRAWVTEDPFQGDNGFVRLVVDECTRDGDGGLHHIEGSEIQHLEARTHGGATGRYTGEFTLEERVAFWRAGHDTVDLIEAASPASPELLEEISAISYAAAMENAGHSSSHVYARNG